MQRPRNEGLLKLFFGAEAPAGSNAARVNAVREHHRGLLARYDAVEKQIRQQYHDHPDLPYWLMTLDFGQRHSGMIVSWCDETLQKLERLAGRRGSRKRKHAG